jgi:hypothetical protein
MKCGKVSRKELNILPGGITNKYNDVRQQKRYSNRLRPTIIHWEILALYTAQ